MLRVNSNGSKFAGEKPDTIEKLIEVLANHPLDRRFEDNGNFIMSYNDNCTKFFGNFYTLSHVFNIVTDEADVIEQLTTAIKTNLQRPDYRRQPDPNLRKKQQYIEDSLLDPELSFEWKKPD